MFAVRPMLASGGVADLSALSVTDLTADPVSPNARIVYRANGDLDSITVADGTVDLGSWFTPEQSGIGNSYWIKATNVTGSGGTFTDPSAGSWIQLSTDRQWELSIAVVGFVSRSFTISIATAASDAAIVETHTVTLIAEKTT